MAQLPATNFDGLTDYYQSGTQTVSNGKTAIISVWLKPTGFSNYPRFYQNANGGWFIRIDNSGIVRFDVKSAAGVTRLRFVTVGTVSTGSWNHILASWDTTNEDDTNDLHCYISGSDANPAASSFRNDDDLGYNGSTHTLGGPTNGSSATWLFPGCIAEFWIGFNQYLDFSVQANREKFINSSGEAVDLGSDGSTPTGTAPIIYCTGGEAAFGTNLGSGGTNFTQNGTPVDCADGPDGVVTAITVEPTINNFTMANNTPSAILNHIMRTGAAN